MRIVRIILWHCFGNMQRFKPGKVDNAMQIGLVLSAILGGLTGTVWSVVQDHGLPRVLSAYPLGGLLAVLAFLLLTSLRSDRLGQQPDWTRQD